jgi:RNA polymerase sigma-70 factor (ECF subfamily)
MARIATAESNTAPPGQPPPGSRRADELEQLMSAMAAGDRRALARIYQQTVAQVFGIARAVLRSKEDAEEVVCDVYFCAWQRAKSFDPARGSVAAWLSVMTRNRAVDRLRQRRAVPTFEDHRYRDPAIALDAGVNGPEEILARFESGSAINRALDSLTPQRRRLLALAFFQGLSHQEIAAAVGMPLGTVKSHVRRALASLHAAIIARVERNAPADTALSRPIKNA